MFHVGAATGCGPGATRARCDGETPSACAGRAGRAHSALLLLILAASLLLGCSESTQEAGSTVDSAVQAATEAVAGTIEQTDDVKEAAAPAATAAVLALQEAVEVITEPLPPAVPAGRRELDPLATALITRWEVTSEAVYVRKYQGVICPGGASGPTIGIGYDLGHQTASTIRADWRAHADVARLATGSGQVGPAKCAAWRAQHRDVRVPLAMAQAVFEESTLPAYTRAAERALGKQAWAGLPIPYRAGMKSLGYNRGWSMVGERRREMRAIRDDCVPPADAACGARELLSMCRLWAGTPNDAGLCGRRKDEARVITRH